VRQHAPRHLDAAYREITAAGQFAVVVAWPDRIEIVAADAVVAPGVEAQQRRQVLETVGEDGTQLEAREHRGVVIGQAGEPLAAAAPAQEIRRRAQRAVARVDCAEPRAAVARIHARIDPRARDAGSRQQVGGALLVGAGDGVAFQLHAGAVAEGPVVEDLDRVAHAEGRGEGVGVLHALVLHPRGELEDVVERIAVRNAVEGLDGLARLGDLGLDAQRMAVVVQQRRVAVEAQPQRGIGAEAQAHLVAAGHDVLGERGHVRAGIRPGRHAHDHLAKKAGVAQTLLEARHELVVEGLAGAEPRQRCEQRVIDAAARNLQRAEGVARAAGEVQPGGGGARRQVDAQLRDPVLRVEEAQAQAAAQQLVAKAVVVGVGERRARGQRARAQQRADGRQRGGGLVDGYLGCGEPHPRAGFDVDHQPRAVARNAELRLVVAQRLQRVAHRARQDPLQSRLLPGQCGIDIAEMRAQVLLRRVVQPAHRELQRLRETCRWAQRQGAQQPRGAQQRRGAAASVVALTPGDGQGLGCPGLPRWRGDRLCQ
jgi:hypothetical protein